MSKYLNSFVVRAALVAASFVATSGMMLGVGFVFDSASREPWLRDSPQARLAMADCSARSSRAEQRGCARRVLAAAQAREAHVAVAAAESK